MVPIEAPECLAVKVRRGRLRRCSETATVSSVKPLLGFLPFKSRPGPAAVTHTVAPGESPTVAPQESTHLRSTLFTMI